MKRLIIMIMLISNCAKVINNLNTLNKSIEDDLIEASREGNIGKIINLLAQSVDVNYKNEGNDRYTSFLIIASVIGNKEIAKMLIEKGVDINDENIYGNTVLVYASSEGHIEIVKLLVEAGTDIKAAILLIEMGSTIDEYKNIEIVSKIKDLRT